MWKKIVAFFTMIFQFIAGLFSVSPTPPTPTPPEKPDSAYIESFIASETDYILSLILDNGAVCMTYPMYDYTLASAELPDIDGVAGEVYRAWSTALVNPYFAATAVQGIIKASPERSKAAAESFIEWYFNTMNTAQTDYNGLDGTIYDCRVFINPDDNSDVLQISQRELYAAKFTAGEVNTYGYDSTDSYAALFLSVLADYANAYNDLALLDSHKADIDRVCNVLQATYSEAVGMTAAKPDYAMCYLMDNCEVYAGLIDAAELYNKLGETVRAENVLAKAQSIKAGIDDVLYNSFTGHYHAAAGTNGHTALEATNSALERFYPEGAAQLFPIIFGVIDSDSERAKNIYADFCSRFVGNNTEGKDWSVLKLGGFPWAVLLRASVIMEDYETVEKYLDTLKILYLDNNHAYPYYTAEAGSVLLALADINN